MEPTTTQTPPAPPEKPESPNKPLPATERDFHTRPSRASNPGFRIAVLIGMVVLLVVGFFATGPCPDKNKDAVSDAVFVLGWPVYLYDDVAHGSMTAPQWLHRQACEGGVAKTNRDAMLER